MGTTAGAAGPLTGVLSALPLAAAFPPLPAAVRTLAASIAEIGQLEPTVFVDGLILDGRNRFEARQLVGGKPVFLGERE